MSKFPNILKSLRESRALTQERLGEILGVAKSTISVYESGRREPNFETLEAIADCFNVSLSSLLGDDVLSGYAVQTPLSKEERVLLDDYRALSDQGRLYVHQSIRLALRAYEKEGSLGVLEKSIKERKSMPVPLHKNLY